MKKILETDGVERSAEEIEQARKAAEKHMDIEELPILIDEFSVKWDVQLLEHLGIWKNVPFLAEEITKLWWHYSDVELYTDAEKTLKLLKQSGLKTLLIDSEDNVEEGVEKIGSLTELLEHI